MACVVFGTEFMEENVEVEISKFLVDSSPCTFVYVIIVIYILTFERDSKMKRRKSDARESRLKIGNKNAGRSSSRIECEG